MNVDLYTKAVLTVIAGCLVVLTVRELTRTETIHAAAPDKVQKVMITGVKTSDQLPVNLQTIGDHPADRYTVELPSGENSSKRQRGLLTAPAAPTDR